MDVTSELLQPHRRELRHEDDDRDGDERGQEMRGGHVRTDERLSQIRKNSQE